jgi:hypothetical protein
MNLIDLLAHSQRRPRSRPYGGGRPAPGAQRSQMRGGGQAWGGQNFQNVGDLVAWINARGGHTSNAQFMGNHPGAFGGVQRRPPSPVEMPGGAPGPVVEGARAGAGSFANAGLFGHQMGSPFRLPGGPPSMVGGGRTDPGGGQNILPPPVHRPGMYAVRPHYRRRPRVSSRVPPILQQLF